MRGTAVRGPEIENGAVIQYDKYASRTIEFFDQKIINILNFFFTDVDVVHKSFWLHSMNAMKIMT